VVSWVSSCLSSHGTTTYIFTVPTCTATLEPCAWNAETQHFILRLNKKIHYFVDTTERGDRSLQRHPKDRVGNMEEWTEKLCPQNSAPAVSLGENGDKQFCKEKFHAANGKAQHALMHGPIFFFLRGQGEMDFFFFPPCSQCVPILFPKGYESVPQDVPHSTCALSYVVWFGWSSTPCR
jgi:hypothetical protein